MISYPLFPSDDNEKIEEGAKGGDVEHGRCDGDRDIPEVPGKDKAEEQQGSLQHHRQ